MVPVCNSSQVIGNGQLTAGPCFLLFFFLMSPILTSLLLGLTAAGANVFGGAIIVQKHWERSYLRYFVALGAGFMLATALVEMVPDLGAPLIGELAVEVVVEPLDRLVAIDVGLFGPHVALSHQPRG